MAASPDQIIENLLSTIDSAIGDFNKSLPDIQKQAFAKVIKLASELELSNGRIKPTVVNIRIFNRIKKEIENTIISKQYLKNLDKFILTWDAVETANGKYFSAINEKYTPGTIFAEIKKQMIDETISSLTESGIGERITKPIQNILRTNIVSGAHYEDLVQEMRQYLTDTKTGEGALVRYSRQITTDSINQYNANYNQIATSDLGLVWYKYVGSLMRTSREFCIKLIEAKQTCMPYIHVSQFQSIIDGNICGEKVAINKKTGLPHGFIDGTNASNFMIRRGGFFCQHQVYPVSSAIVPQSLRDKFE